MKLPKQAREYLRKIGRAGGRSRSPAKTAAVKRNLEVAWARQRQPQNVPVSVAQPAPAGIHGEWRVGGAS